MQNLATTAPLALPVIDNEPLDFQRVYADHVHFVFRVLRGMGVRDEAIEDATQDIFLVVHRKLAQFDGRAAVRTWLFAIALRVARDHRRKRRRVDHHEPLADALVHDGPGPLDQTERAETARAVGAALDQLPEEQRVMLVLADIEGMSAPEIAELTRLKLSNVYTRLRRARLAFDAVWSRAARRPR